MQNLKYFTWSIGFTVFGLVGGYLIGGWPAAFIVAVLAVLETSLSFDNAVVNATVLRDMTPLWRHRFLTWGIAIVFGVGIGSFLYAVATKSFRWEHFISAQDMFRHIIGAVLMGFGGVTAMGCTIGQGITGFSTLSLGSILATISIVVGATATMKYEYMRMMREAG